MTDKTCAERIDQEMSDRVETILDIRKRMEEANDNDDYDQYENLREELYELPISVEVKKTVEIVLSTGGPHDHILYYLDSNNEPYSATYHFKDWFDGASTPMTGEAMEAAMVLWEELGGSELILFED